MNTKTPWRSAPARWDFCRRAAGLALSVYLAGGSGARAADPFEDIIRKTEPLTPEQERRAFHLPPGFEIQLVASEPAIGKPMNLAFDERGRLWLTQSREYPFPAPSGQPARDAVKVLSAWQPNGRAGAVATFAEGLNIPIGIYPYRGGAITFSIPYVHYLQDTNHDGRADTDTTVLGRYGFDRDTHGLTSSFRRGYDGWIYADHGFNNNTTLTAADGSSITMNSGNCYRFQPDGSRVEQYSWGQVNPFGLMFDPLGDLWSADCHSAPVYQLLRGAYYPSFGKPDDGLGFGPSVIAHQHGSTAIAGMVHYDATNFPAEYRENTFIGNVMTCRINRDSYVAHGSTRPGREEADFLSCDDPWFRPVDLQLGPDGAIYVADFYNRIIGHYEVPLDHPGRDRERGRIWRIVYTGGQAAAAAVTPAEFNLETDTPAELVRKLGHSNITLRQLVMNHLVDNVGAAAAGPVAAMLRDRGANAFQKLHGLWVLHRLGKLEPELLARAAADGDRLVRTHAMRVLSETPAPSPAQAELARAGLRDPDAFVRRAAADALGRHADRANLAPLLALLREAPADDSQLRHTARMALRNQLIPAGNFAGLDGVGEPAARALADVAVAVATPEAGAFLVRHCARYAEPQATLARYLRHAARYVPASEIDRLAAFARDKFADDVDQQYGLFKSVQDGLAQRGTAPPAAVREWGAALAAELLRAAREAAGGWYNSPAPGRKESANPWSLQDRPSADGVRSAPFLSSLPAGETLTGVLRSPEFPLPAELRFFLAGHDGYPNQPLQHQNSVRLRAAEGTLLAETSPPRNDLAQPMRWDLAAHAGQHGYVEITDGDEATAYAWLAVGRFEPAVVPWPTLSPNQNGRREQTAAELARTLELKELTPTFRELLTAPGRDLATRAAAARALVVLEPGEIAGALAPLLGDGALAPAVHQEVIGALTVRGDESARTALRRVLQMAPFRAQVAVAQALAGSRGGAETLLALMEEGAAAPSLLLNRTVKDKLTAAGPERGAPRVAALSGKLTPASETVQKLIDERRAGYAKAPGDPGAGAQLFNKVCSVCHTIDGRGGLVGPQLDGVGGRGLERLMEDVLDPSRNVDRAFRTHIITLKNGDVVSGLPRREEGELLVLANAAGQEVSLPKQDIVERRESETSLMPDNFGEMLTPADFNHLMAFLLTKGPAPAAKAKP